MSGLVSQTRETPGIHLRPTDSPQPQSSSSPRASFARSGAGQSELPLLILSMEPSGRYAILTAPEAPMAREKAARMTVDLMIGGQERGQL